MRASAIELDTTSTPFMTVAAATSGPVRVAIVNNEGWRLCITSRVKMYTEFMQPVKQLMQMKQNSAPPEVRVVYQPMPCCQMCLCIFVQVSSLLDKAKEASI